MPKPSPSDHVWHQAAELYQETYYRFANERRLQDAVLFGRAGFTDAQTFP